MKACEKPPKRYTEIYFQSFGNFPKKDVYLSCKEEQVINVLLEKIWVLLISQIEHSHANRFNFGEDHISGHLEAEIAKGHHTSHNFYQPTPPPRHPTPEERQCKSPL